MLNETKYTSYVFPVAFGVSSFALFYLWFSNRNISRTPYRESEKIVDPILSPVKQERKKFESFG